MQKGIKRLGDAELEIMLVVWQAEEGVNSTYVHEKLKGRRDWALPAVITAMNRLVDKGFLSCEKRGRGNLYRPQRRGLQGGGRAGASGPALRQQLPLFGSSPGEPGGHGRGGAPGAAGVSG